MSGRRRAAAVLLSIVALQAAAGEEERAYASKSARSWWDRPVSRPSGMRDRPVLRMDLTSVRRTTCALPSALRRVTLLPVSAERMPLSVSPPLVSTT